METTAYSAEEAAELFNTEMAKLFPDYIVQAKVKQGLGLHMTFQFFNASSLDKAPNKIIQNATAYCSFMMHLSDGSGKTIDYSLGKFSIESITMSYEARDRLEDEGTKFRKITAKTPKEAAQKLVNWFKKNQSILLSMSMN